MLESILSWYAGLTDTLVGSLGLFAVGLVLLIKGGDWFVDSASAIAKRFRVPEIIIGATVVSIGTTLPEVMVSATAAINHNGAIAYGNAIGSIICNTALISALTIAIRPAPVNKKAIVMPVLFFFISAAIYLVAAYVFGSFDRWLGIVMLCVFALYMTLTIRQGFKNPTAEEHVTVGAFGVFFYESRELFAEIVEQCFCELLVFRYRDRCNKELSVGFF